MEQIRLRKSLLIVICMFLFVAPVYAADSIERRLDRIEVKLEKLDRLEAVVTENRERLIKLEEGQKGIHQRIDDTGKRIDDLGKRIDDLANLIYVVLAGMFALVGFVIWDRRTALAPAVKRVKDLEEREECLERAIKEFARKEPRLADALRHAGLIS